MNLKLLPKTQFLTLCVAITTFVSLGIFQNTAQGCVVISGLIHDQNYAFSDYYKYIKNCKTYNSFQDFCKTKPKKLVIDLRVIAHGKKDGTVHCNKQNESPKKILSCLNQLSKSNKVFASFDSCFSSEILKEKILFDDKQKNPKLPTLKNLCLYVAAAPKRAAFVDEKSFSDFQFLKQDQLKNKSIIEIYQQTSTGLLSAAPYNESGITNYWKNFKKKTTMKHSIQKFIKILRHLNFSNVSTRRCLTIKSCISFSPEDFYLVSSNLSRYERYLKSFNDIKKWTIFVKSYESLMKNPYCGKLFRKFIAQDDLLYPSYRKILTVCGFKNLKRGDPIYKRCFEEKLSNEPFCQHLKHWVDSREFALLNSKYKLNQFINKVNPKNPVSFSTIISASDYEKRLLLEVNKSIHKLNECSLRAILGYIPKNRSDSLGYVSGEQYDSRGWESVLGTLNRISLLKQNINRWKDPVDREHYKTCSKFYYDKKGVLQFK